MTVFTNCILWLWRSKVSELLNQLSNTQLMNCSMKTSQLISPISHHLMWLFVSTIVWQTTMARFQKILQFINNNHCFHKKNTESLKQRNRIIVYHWILELEEVRGSKAAPCRHPLGVLQNCTFLPWINTSLPFLNILVTYKTIDATYKVVD